MGLPVGSPEGIPVGKPQYVAPQSEISWSSQSKHAPSSSDVDVQLKIMFVGGIVESLYTEIVCSLPT